MIAALESFTVEGGVESLEQLERLDEAQLSLAWAYLYQEDPMLPVPKELKHLTAPEWELANNLLLQNLHLRELLPLQ